jgi:purine-cytosine permease-like protein
MASSEKVAGSWGIEPVPPRLRVLGALDTGLLWGNLGVSLLVVAAGAALVPALSLRDALVAILLGCLVGNLMLGTAGAIGAACPAWCSCAPRSDGTVRTCRPP